MKVHKKYRITIEEETHLRHVGRIVARPGFIWLCAMAVFLCMGVLGVLLVSVTPLRALLPGYLKPSERSATVEGLLRLDSLREAFEVSQAFLDNYMNVLDTERAAAPAEASAPEDSVSGDTLIGPGTFEKAFMARMDERERFNISVLAPLAAEAVDFLPISSDGIYAKETEGDGMARLVIGGTGPLRSPADGTVISVTHSTSEGYSEVILHKNGFTTRLTHTGVPTAAAGERVTAGEAVAMAPSPDASGRRWVGVRLWHNGHSLPPARYFEPDAPAAASVPYEAPRGK